jgi:hypothetical protein
MIRPSDRIACLPVKSSCCTAVPRINSIRFSFSGLARGEPASD